MLVTGVGKHSMLGQLTVAMGPHGVVMPVYTTPLQDKLAKFASTIGYFGLWAALVIFVEQLIKYFATEGQGDDDLRNVARFLMIAVAIVVLAVPKGLQLAVFVSIQYAVRHVMRDHDLLR